MEDRQGSARLLHRRTTFAILGCAIDVHRSLGPGLLESAYRRCLVQALELKGLAVEQEVPVSITYEGCKIEGAFRADIVVNRSVLLELKAVDRLLPIHDAQILTYLKLLRVRVGLLVNFNVRRLMDGVHRFVL
ncbi:MAG TPA: GxxExxY protein [Usitatibacter sp.]|nr:GxxExxY protein [Usitatibacter sp.]